MPTASLTADITVGTPSAGVYPVTYTITAEQEFGELEMLVMRQNDDTFDRVATLFDLGDYPTTSTPGIEFYRAVTATVNFTDVDKATAGIQSFKDAIDLLVQNYAAYRSRLITETVTYSETWT